MKEKERERERERERKRRIKRETEAERDFEMDKRVHHFTMGKSSNDSIPLTEIGRAHV